MKERLGPLTGQEIDVNPLSPPNVDGNESGAAQSPSQGRQRLLVYVHQSFVLASGIAWPASPPPKDAPQGSVGRVVDRPRRESMDEDAAARAQYSSDLGE
jgi:hypothetical protein